MVGISSSRYFFRLSTTPLEWTDSFWMSSFMAVVLSCIRASTPVSTYYYRSNSSAITSATFYYRLSSCMAFASSIWSFFCLWSSICFPTLSSNDAIASYLWLVFSWFFWKRSLKAATYPEASEDLDIFVVSILVFETVRIWKYTYMKRS